MNSDILRDIVVVLLLSVGVAYALRYLKISSIVGFILAGIAVGPAGLALVRDRHGIETIAEVGVILLLFTLGLKLSLGKLLAMKRLVFVAGGAQTVLTIGAAALIGSAFGMNFRIALFIAFLLAMSSTAIVIKVLEERNETDTPHGRLMTGVLLFQDLAVVPLMLLTQTLARGTETSWLDAGIALLKSLMVVALIVATARLVYPRLIERVVRTGSREIFTIMVVLAALGTAFLAQRLGLSLALGAFLAGIVISESDHSYRILMEIVPLRDVFTSMFFVSMGMLVVPGGLLDTPQVSFYALGLIILKVLILAVLALLFGYGPRVALLASLGLAQVGEFSFILAAVGNQQGLLADNIYQAFLSVSVITMALTPLVMMLSTRLSTGAQNLSRLEHPLAIDRQTHGMTCTISGQAPDAHVVIVGFGVCGRQVARMLRMFEIPYLILELNPYTVRKYQALDEPIFYGDAARDEAIHNVCIGSAKVLVVAINDPLASRTIVMTARLANPSLFIIVRTRYLSEVDELIRLGANEVVPEEFETSIEMAGLVMTSYGLGHRIIKREQRALRLKHYSLLRQAEAAAAIHHPLKDLLAEADLEELVIEEGSPVIGMDLNSICRSIPPGSVIVAIDRGGEIIMNPADSLKVKNGDILHLAGKSADIAAAASRLHCPPPG